MGFFPALATWQFAAAGALCAAVPVVLHLLNRRRYRVVEWAAMQFLREAMQRSRRIMQIRDLLLMLLRAAAVLLFGLALARPFLAASQEQPDTGQPVHAILLIDNSLSMGYQTLEGTLLDRAKGRAAEFVERLPVGSRISVVPLVAIDSSVSDPFDTKPAALDALQRITLADRSITLALAVNESRRCAERIPDLAPRAVFFTDQQRTTWTDLGAVGGDVELPAMQVVDVSDADWGNTWIAELSIPDGVADAETPTVIHVRVRHRGREPRRDVRVGLWVRDREIDSKLVSFAEAEGEQELTFEHTFADARPAEAEPEFVPIKASLSPDRLPEDDERHAVVPVVAVLPVVFVDQYGDEEDAARNRWGETRPLRQLLGTVTGQREGAQGLIRIRHLRVEQLDRDVLADARLVVIAGVADPGNRVTLLREYVEQGGQVVIAAGAQFDPVAWNSAGWRDGAGILPLPLQADLLGSLPGRGTTELKPLFLSFESLGQHPYFQLAGNAEQNLRELYSEPFFFQAVQVDANSDALQLAEQSGRDVAADDERPRWLTWTPSEPPTKVTSSAANVLGVGANDATDGASAATVADASTRPRILARFTHESGPPFLVERSLGDGQVLFAASGLQSDWNTLSKTNAIVMFDRILRSMLQGTLPARNYGPVAQIALPLPDEVRDERLVLFRPGPDARDQTLETGFLRTDQFGTTIERPFVRGLYRIQTAGGLSAVGGEEGDTTRPISWRIDLAVNGDEQESDLEPWDRAEVAEPSALQNWRWVGPGEEVNLAGATVRGQNLWWWLALLVLLLMIGELVFLGWPQWFPEVATQ